ncbi:hypothetical protein WJX81_003250 [Elliptochloris bilobata]|uniref:Photosystem II 10 kDa polypeptide, chloroplastic n=1 Tax=Elliptochloris bilobata TaxID=381761 RepID=A0AAW1RC81_9CHLO
MAATCTSSFLGTSLSSRPRTATPAGRRGGVIVQAGLLNKGIDRGAGRSAKDRATVERGERSQVKKAKKLLPWDQKLFDSQPGRSLKMKDARNIPREGGFGGGGPYQKLKKGIPSAAGTRPLPSIDPLVYVGGLLAVFVAITLALTGTNNSGLSG